MLDGIGSTEALHIFLSNTLGDERPGTSGRGRARLRASKLLDDDGAEVTDARHARATSTCAGRRSPPGTGAATAATPRRLPRRAGCAPATCTPAPTDGYWTFLGRNNDMIKAGGIWVSPAEVESVLIEHPDVLEAAVVGARNADGLEEAVAFVVAPLGRRHRHRRDRRPLPRAHGGVQASAPAFVVDELPKTATGKIQRFALRERLNDTP